MPLRFTSSITAACLLILSKKAAILFFQHYFPYGNLCFPKETIFFPDKIEFFPHGNPQPGHCSRYIPIGKKQTAFIVAGDGI